MMFPDFDLLKKFNGLTLKNIECEDMKLFISFEETDRVFVISSEDKYCGIEWELK